VFGIEDCLKTHAVCAITDMWCSDSLRAGRSRCRIPME